MLVFSDGVFLGSSRRRRWCPCDSVGGAVFLTLHIVMVLGLVGGAPLDFFFASVLQELAHFAAKLWRQL